MTTGRLVTPFTAKPTTAEVVAGVDLNSLRAVVTGGAGAEVTFAVRNAEPGNRTAEDIGATTPRSGSPSGPGRSS